MKATKRLKRTLLRRDDWRCGVHLGGCGERIRNYGEATVDHIFTKSFFKDREPGIEPADCNKVWNLQPMHCECNNRRGGQIYGFPVFSCRCHWLEIVAGENGGHIVMLHYMTEAGEETWEVCTERHDFVGARRLSTGKFSDSFGGAEQVQVGSLWSMPVHRPGPKEKVVEAVVGEGWSGHAFPALEMKEVQVFNAMEQLRRMRVRDALTIEWFNRRMNPASIEVHYTATIPAERES